MATRSSLATLAASQRPASHVAPRLEQWWRRALAVAAAWHERARQRRHLAGMSDHQLRDIGLRRSDVDYEVRKPFWQP